MAAMEQTSKVKPNPCLKCGACCSAFRVSFHWSETLGESFGVPSELTTEVNHAVNAMKYSDFKNLRCIALDGYIGEKVSCHIYENRSSTCREFKASFEDGEHNPRCDRARAKWGLKPLTLGDWAPQEQI